MRSFAASLLALTAFGICVFAAVVELMPYDARMYLTAAWSFLDPDRPFAIVSPNFRQPLYPLLLAPCLADATAAPFGFLAKRLPHLIAAVVTAGYLFTSWQILQRLAKDRALLFAALLLCLNPVLLHYGAMPMHDLPAGLLLNALLLLWLRWRSAPTLPLVYAMITVAAAIVAMRLNLGIVIPALVVATAIAFYREDPHTWRQRTWRAILAAGTAVGLGFLLMILLYAWADRSWSAGPDRLLNLLQALTSIPPYPTDPVWEYGWSLAISMGPALLLLPVGCICGLRSRDDAPLTITIITLVVILTQSLVIGHNEVRYLLPVAFGIAWLTALGFDRLVAAVPPRLAAPVLGLLLIWPGVQTVRAIQRLADPVYHTPFVAPLAQTIRDARADGRPVYWNGNTHPIAPRDFLFSRYDEYYAVWHFGIPDWYLATGTHLRHVAELPPEAFTESQRATFLARERALVVQGRRQPYYTNDLVNAGRLPPIILLWYDPDPNSAAGYRIRRELRHLPGWNP